MMVDEFKKDTAQWQSTVPQQMPWMSSYDSAAYAMQFGHHSLPPHLIDTNPSITDPFVNTQHLLGQQQYIHPTINSFSSPSSLTTSLVTACPTTMSTGIMVNSSPTSITTNIQPCPMIPNLIQSSQNSPYESSYVQHTSMLVPNKLVGTSFDPTCSLTHIPSSSTTSTEFLATQHKRRSTEMEEDEPFKAEEPPTKQLLSERKLFKQFGSLQIDGILGENEKESHIASDDSDDSEEELVQVANSTAQPPGREEFNRYVYLLFKDKKGDSSSFSSDSTFDRLFREERDKLSKAVVLWNPKLRSPDAIDDGDESDEEEFKYLDHTDFLKDRLNKRNVVDDDSIIITEVTEDAVEDTISIPETNKSIYCEQDDLMLE